MKISRKKFVLTFLFLSLAFQFISNSILGNEVGLFPNDGQWFSGHNSSINWKKNLSGILYPIKFVLIKPLAVLVGDEDSPPPILLFAFTIYWTLIALILHYLYSFGRT
jgi:hypothetical protein